MNLLLIQSSPYLPAYHGASLSNRLVLEALAARGHACRAIAPAHLDEPGFGEPEFRARLSNHHLVSTRIADGVDAFCCHGVQVYATDTKTRVRTLTQAMAREFDATWALVSTEDPGQVLLETAVATFGGRVIYTAHTPMLIPADDASPFGNRSKAALLTRVAAVITVSQFAKAHIDRLIDVRSVVLPLLQYGRPPFPNYGCFSRGYVTMINPSALKGISIFFEVARRMPHVSFAAVAAWGTSAADRRALSGLPNVTILEPSEDVESFYAQTRALLVPSLCPEGHARVITEALLRGIPVVASDIGGTPDAALGVGRLVPVRAIERYVERFDRQGRWIVQPEIPVQDAAPWCRALDELLGDRDRYETLSRESHAIAARHVSANGIEVLERFLETLPPASDGGTLEPRASTRPACAAPADSRGAMARARQLPPRKRAALIALLKRRGLLQLDRHPIPCHPRSPDAQVFPVSSAQQQLWIVEQLQPGGTAYNLPTALRLRGPIDGSALERSLAAIVARHEVLRTSFPHRDGEPMQRVAPHLTFVVPVVDLSGLSVRRRGRETQALVCEEAARPFDLVNGPLLRMGLVKCAAEEHVLLFTMHHLIADGVSTGVLVRDLTASYEGFVTNRPASLPPLRVQYADYAVWEREQLAGGVLEQELTYWRQKLALPLPVMALAGAAPRPIGARWRGGQVRRRVEQLAGALQRVGQAHGATVFMTLVAGLQVLLHTHSGASDIIVGTDVSGRDRDDLAEAIGLFVNQIVLRADLRGDPTFATFLGQVKQVTLEAHAHQRVPFERVVAAINPMRLAGSQPLFQVKVIIRNPKGDAVRVAGGLTLEPESVRAPTANLDLLFNIAQIGTTLDVTLEHDADRYDPATAERALDDYVALLRDVAQRPEARISALGEGLIESSRARALSRHAVYEGSFRAKTRSLRRPGLTPGPSITASEPR